MVAVTAKNKEFNYDVESLTDEQLFSALKDDGIELSGEAIQLARNGDGNKLYEIGYQYHNLGKLRRALIWIFKAAVKNHSMALYDIGCAYHHGFGITHNYQLARRWYLEAIKSDKNQYAQLNIGMLYYQGQGVPGNVHTAVKWIRKSADQGNTSARATLAYIYRSNKEITNEQKSKEFLQRAVDQGDQDSKYCEEEVAEKEEFFVEEVKDNSEIESDISDKNTTLGQDVSYSDQNKSLKTIQNLQEQMKLIEEKISSMEVSSQLKLEQLQQELAASHIESKKGGASNPKKKKFFMCW